MNDIVRDFIPPIAIKVAKHLKSQCKSICQTEKNKIANYDINGKYLYYGNLLPDEPQFKNDKFIGLALTPLYPKDIKHNAHDNLPFKDNSINKIQSQDVFEHLEYDKLPHVFNEIYRVLSPGGVFRLSLPDYNSPPLWADCIFDHNGNVIADISCGGSVIYDRSIPGKRVVFTTDGGAHLWFPTYDVVNKLIDKSNIKNCTTITFYHYFKNREEFVCNPIPENEMFISRIPPHDTRAEGKPLSIVVDFVK
jgi:SAM-dependent methyltransferase